MKYPLAIFAAAAAAVTAMIHLVLGDRQPKPVESDEATPIPPITPRLVEKYALAGATDAEIADRFLLDASVIRSDYRDVLRATRAVRAISIRGFEYELAKKLNGSMLTWLGRNELGQSLSPAPVSEDDPSYDQSQLS